VLFVQCLYSVLIIVFWMKLLVVLVCNVPVKKQIYEEVALPTFCEIKLYHTLIPENLCVRLCSILSVF
jgi:hypothetical protein